MLVDGEPEDLDVAVDRVERFYAEAGQPSIFLVSTASTPPVVRDHLVSRGYESSADTWVLSRTVPAEQAEPSEWNVVVSPEPDAKWFDAYWEFDGGGRSMADAHTLREVLLRPAAPAAFVAVEEPTGTVVAVGQVVVADSWGCIQCLATRPEVRRRGAGRAAVNALIDEAVRLGATGLVAAVMADNDASLGLFQQLGFERSHQYSYYRA